MSTESTKLSLRFDAEANPFLTVEAHDFRIEAPISELAPVLAHPGVVLQILGYAISNLDEVAPDPKIRVQMLDALRTVVKALEAQK
jgi:hypothetical protein